ncbi:MAG: hypothetical protein WAM14_05590 [Candidatus Nitrosopolaris sp.]
MKDRRLYHITMSLRKDSFLEINQILEYINKSDLNVKAYQEQLFKSIFELGLNRPQKRHGFEEINNFFAFLMESFTERTKMNVESSQLTDHLRNSEWDRLIPIIDETIVQLKSGHYPVNIDQLIKATLNTLALQEEDYDVFLHDVTLTLNTYFKDIKSLFNLEKKEDLLNRAEKCKEVIELAENLTHIAKEEGLPSLRQSQLIKVDDFHGRPVYTVKE